MNEKQLCKLEEQLYRHTWLAGGWQRRQAAEALAKDGSPEAVQLLAYAVAQSNDAKVRQIALAALGLLEEQSSIDAFCAVWAKTRHAELGRLVTEHAYVASQPDDLRMLSALKAQRLHLITEGGAVIVEPLLRACNDNDSEIAGRAREASSTLDSQGKIEAACEILIVKDDPIALEVAIAAGYAPRDQYRRALFLFLTGQWEKYEDLDFEHNLLQREYENADQTLRGRVLAKARESGRVEWVGVVSGGRTGRRLGEMTNAEWDGVLEVLAGVGRWGDIWRLAQESPPLWAARMIERLGKTDWLPSDEEAAHSYQRLLEMAVVCSRDEPGLQHARIQATLEGHSSSVRFLAISPVGDLLASASRDETIRLWHLPGGEHVRNLEGHANDVISLAISPDGGFLASGSYQDIRLWSVPDGERLRTLKGHTNWVYSLAISPDCCLLASGGLDKTIRLWRIPGGENLRTLEGHTSPITSLAISPDGSLLASGSIDSTVRLWRLPNGEHVRILQGHNGYANSLAFSPEGGLLAAASSRTIRLWSVPGGERLSTLHGHSEGVNCLAISPKGSILASGSIDNTIRLWRLPGGEHLRTLEGHCNGLLAISPDGGLLATGGFDNTIRLWAHLAYRLSRLPVRLISFEELELAQETLRDTDLSNPERAWLVFIVTLVQFRRRHDIALEAARRRIEVGEFDIEIEE